MSRKADVSTTFPYESQYVEVLGSRMHYIEQGVGDPILFLHGNPTSSYLWRDIIPHVSVHGRCIAVDLIGMGRSDKPDLPYRFADHARYLDAFIEALGLDRVTLVVHDWGSALGFHWAHRHPERVRGIAFMEAIVAPMTWAGFPKGYKLPFKLMRTAGTGWLMLSVANVFLKQIMPKSIVRKLTAEEQAFYAAPYRTIASRKPIRQWPCEIPIEGEPADVHEVVVAYNAWLQETEIPKLLFTARPGAILRKDLVTWCREKLPNLEVIDLGKGLHYLQEDHPDAIGENIARWYVAAVQVGLRRVNSA
ncbi:MAG: haloalkane dehalogenase [Deltaproteobacteria bacterium]|nr:haloalkane dehalogenase [Deltaproteobacteria bacterium]MBW2258645.1 haloalkane dehalogenase [Deltaproteobacteria bacterium]